MLDRVLVEGVVQKVDEFIGLEEVVLFACFHDPFGFHHHTEILPEPPAAENGLFLRGSEGRVKNM